MFLIFTNFLLINLSFSDENIINQHYLRRQIKVKFIYIKMEEAVEINLNKLALKCHCKKEMYNLMVTDCDIYMPPIADANSWYVREVMVGTIKVIKLLSHDYLSSMLKQVKVKALQVTQIKKLSRTKMIEFSNSISGLNSYLPKYRKYRLTNRTWVWNISKLSLFDKFIVHPILGDSFKAWIKTHMMDREKHLVNKQ